MVICVCSVFPNSHEMTVLSLWRYKVTRREELRQAHRGFLFMNSIIPLSGSQPHMSRNFAVSTPRMALSLESN